MKNNKYTYKKKENTSLSDDQSFIILVAIAYGYLVLASILDALS